MLVKHAHDRTIIFFPLIDNQFLKNAKYAASYAFNHILHRNYNYNYNLGTTILSTQKCIQKRLASRNIQIHVYRLQIWSDYICIRAQPMCSFYSQSLVPAVSLFGHGKLHIFCLNLFKPGIFFLFCCCYNNSSTSIYTSCLCFFKREKVPVNLSCYDTGYLVLWNFVQPSHT